MLKEITAKEALERYLKGEDVKALAPYGPGDGWEDYTPFTLRGMLETARFLVDEPEAVPDKPEAQDTVEIAEPEVIPVEEAIPDEAEAETETEIGAQEPEPKKARPRLNLDEGKIRALYEAGWSNIKIAEEMGTSDMTIGKRVKAMRERGEIDEAKRASSLKKRGETVDR